MLQTDSDLYGALNITLRHAELTAHLWMPADIDAPSVPGLPTVYVDAGTELGMTRRVALCLLDHGYTVRRDGETMFAVVELPATDVEVDDGSLGVQSGDWSPL